MRVEIRDLYEACQSKRLCLHLGESFEKLHGDSAPFWRVGFVRDDLLEALRWGFLEWHATRDRDYIQSVLVEMVERSMGLYDLRRSADDAWDFFESFLLHCAVLCGNKDLLNEVAKHVAPANARSTRNRFVSAWNGILKHRILGNPAGEQQQLLLFKRSSSDRLYLSPGSKLASAFVLRDTKLLAVAIRENCKKHWERAKREGAIVERTGDNLVLDLREKNSYSLWGWSDAIFAHLALAGGERFEFDEFWCPRGLYQPDSLATILSPPYLAESSDVSDPPLHQIIQSILRGTPRPPDDPVESVRTAVRGGADVNARDHEGNTALMLAAQTETPNLVRALLELRANPNAENSGKTALSRAARFGHVDSVRQLLKAGAKVNGRGVPPLTEAALSGAIPNVKLLLAARADVNAKTINGDTALIQATKSRETETVKILLKHGATPNVVGCEKGTALRWAAFTSRLDIIKLLVAAGADPNQLAGLTQKAPIHFASDPRVITYLKRLTDRKYHPEAEEDDD